jgi:CRISPR-associated protein Cas1
MSLNPHDHIAPIPARMVNEYAYCPRLFYLEHVQREWAHSADTLEGRYIHRRVDREEGRVPAAEELSDQVRLHSRSVLVGSDRLGAVARIDLIEVAEGRVVPVDYKRGAAPDLPEGAWEPERVQVCLQGLLLRENGYDCDSGVLYFAGSQSRVTVEFTADLIARTMDLLAAARQTAEAGVAPPPLVDSPKCPRCSLAGICLPDEVNLLRNADGGLRIEEDDADADPETRKKKTALGKREPRRLVPARDDRVAVYVQGQGYSLGLKGEVLEIRDMGKVVDEARLLEMSQLNLYGNVQLSAQALRELAGREIPILHLSYGGWLGAVTTPPPHKNIELRQRQFQAAADRATSLQLAREIVAGKIRNQRTLLRRNARELPEGTLHRLAEARRRAERAPAIEQLLGIEGTAAREYFSNFARMFKAAENESAPAFAFESRNRRPPRDPVNALLSFLYSMLAKEMTVTLIGIGFDPYLGFYHQPRYGRPALALDLMEEFRPLVADSVALALINNGELRRSDFIVRAGGVALTDAGRKRVIDAYERRLEALVTHPRFGYAISYRRVFEVQARLLGRFLAGEIPRYPAFCTR